MARLPYRGGGQRGRGQVAEGEIDLLPAVRALVADRRSGAHRQAVVGLWSGAQGEGLGAAQGAPHTMGKTARRLPMRLRALLLSGMMAGMAVVLQTAPIWLGQPAGFALAILAFLPMALVTAIHPRATALTLPVAALLCALFQPEEGWVFGLANGPFGAALGLAFRRGHTGWKAPLLPALTLFGGLALLTWGVGFAALGPDLRSQGVAFALAVYALFALAWSVLLTPIFRLLIRRLQQVMDRWIQTDPPR